MKENEEQLKIDFTNKSEDISDILDMCTSYILKKTAGDLGSIVLSKVKWVLTELLTNAIKHSATSTSTILVSINNDEIILQKYDSGAPMQFHNSSLNQTISWPITNKLYNTSHTIYSSSTEILIAHIVSDGSIKFLVQEIEQEDVRDSILANMSEHFGLLIITKSSTEFSYVYSSDEKMNLFKSIFKREIHSY
jgi:two-component sensor histidine kinase